MMMMKLNTKNLFEMLQLRKTLPVCNPTKVVKVLKGKLNQG